MSDPRNNVFTSPNFAFLMQHDEVLARHAALAERYVFDDPNSALIKLRHFGELLAQNAAAYAGIAVEERDSQHELLDRLRDRQVINAQVAQLFHGLRKAGNQAAHQHTGDRREALHQLQMARKLAVWFHKAFGGDPHFKAGPFVPPPDPRQAERALHTELERLREALVAAQEQMAGTQQLIAEHARLRQQAEAAAQRAYDDLTAVLALATETEQQLAHERQQFQQRLAELRVHVAAAPAEQRAAVVAVAQREAEELDLDEAQTRRMIDAQLREAGWEADTQALTYAAGTRPVKGRNLAIAEWPTGNGPADYVLFVSLTPIAVVEAKRQRRDVAGAIEQARRYSLAIRLQLISKYPADHGVRTTCHSFSPPMVGRFCVRSRRKAASGSVMHGRTPTTPALSKRGMPLRVYHSSCSKTALLRTPGWPPNRPATCHCATIKNRPSVPSNVVLRTVSGSCWWPWPSGPGKPSPVSASSIV